MSVPIIDFGQFLRGNTSEKLHTAEGIDEAFRNYGFVYLKNHGINTKKVDEAFKWNKKFFDLPTNIKNLAPHPPGGSHHRGYSGIGIEKVSQNVFDARELEELKKVNDVKESFESGNVEDELQPNIWLPEDKLPGFRSFMEDWFLDCSDLILSVLKALSTSLNIEDENKLSNTHSKKLFQARLLHYPSIPVSFLKGGTHSRITSHSDFGTLTLLFQDQIGGLQIESPPKSNNFIQVKPIPDTVIVNIGDLMERWSNGRWLSTVHRVIEPPELEHVDTCKDRYSLVFFSTADPDTVIEALPECWNDENPQKYDTVTAWGYVQMRMAALY